MNNYSIEFYSKENGEEPAREFILRLEPKMQAKILKILDLEKSIEKTMKGDFTMSTYNELKKELLKNPEVKAEYDALEPEFNIIQAMIDARKQQNLTQEELSKRTGITQADISRIENGTRNPSLEMVKRLAKGLGMQLKLELVPQVKRE